MLFHTCEKIKSEYMSKIGVLEYKVYEFQCKYLRLKRKVELYQAKINRQEKIDEKEIEKQLDIELAEYQKKIEQMKKDVESSLNRLSADELSEKDSVEAKRIYRKLIKKLHPDLNKNCTENDKKLFLQLVRAYELGDIETLRNLELLCENITENEEIDVGELDELKAKKEKYINMIEKVTDQINIIKNSFPYNQIDFLNDDKQIEEKKAELNKDLELYKEYYSDLEERLKKLKEIK